METDYFRCQTCLVAWEFHGMLSPSCGGRRMLSAPSAAMRVLNFSGPVAQRDSVHNTTDDAPLRGDAPADPFVISPDAVPTESAVRAAEPAINTPIPARHARSHGIVRALLRTMRPAVIHGFVFATLLVSASQIVHTAWMYSDRTWNQPPATPSPSPTPTPILAPTEDSDAVFDAMAVLSNRKGRALIACREARKAQLCARAQTECLQMRRRRGPNIPLTADEEHACTFDCVTGDLYVHGLASFFDVIKGKADDRMWQISKLSDAFSGCKTGTDFNGAHYTTPLPPIGTEEGK